jgi:general secretion pathway protein E
MPAQRLVPSLPIPEELSREYLERHLVLPIAIVDGELQVAAVGDPPNYVYEDLVCLFGVPITLVAVDEDVLHDGLRSMRGRSDTVVELVKDLGDPMLDHVLEASDTSDIRDLANQAPVVRFVNLLIREASEARASDIHLDATRDGLTIRFRVDGVLSAIAAPPRALQDAVFSRVKLMAGLDIAERRLPQDGRLRVRLEERELDLRAATAPNHFGESMTLRLLDRGGRPVTLSDLGMPPDIRESIEALAKRPHGIILSTGPTGSGKTTTLYSALSLRDAKAEKIITVEDPIEYELEDVTQVPVIEKVGLTFPRALKALVRLDPNVLMIGEMRDEESADIAVRSAMTGHLVFSTLHTNDAFSAIPRLIDLKVPAYMVAATVEGVLAQRLVRRICAECRKRYRPDPQVVALLTGRPVGKIQLERGEGCTACRGTGYQGRSGIFELLTVTEEFKEALSRGGDHARLRAILKDAGMRTLREDGWTKVEAGVTTVEEVLRVVQA